MGQFHRLGVLTKADIQKAMGMNGLRGSIS